MKWMRVKYSKGEVRSSLVALIKELESGNQEKFSLVVDPFFGVGTYLMTSNKRQMYNNPDHLEPKFFLANDSNPLIVAALTSIMRKASKTYQKLLDVGYPLHEMSNEEFYNWVTTTHNRFPQGNQLQVLYNRLSNLIIREQNFRVVKYLMSEILDLFYKNPKTSIDEAIVYYKENFFRVFKKIMRVSFERYSANDKSYEKRDSESFNLMSCDFEIGFMALITGSKDREFSYSLRTGWLRNRFCYESHNLLSIPIWDKYKPSLETFYKECFRLLDGVLSCELYEDFIFDQSIVNSYPENSHVLYIIDPPEYRFSISRIRYMKRSRIKHKNTSRTIIDEPNDALLLSAREHSYERRLESRAKISVTQRWRFWRYKKLAKDILKCSQNMGQAKAITFIVIVKGYQAIDEIFGEIGCDIRKVSHISGQNYSMHVFSARNSNGTN